jgi:hypothetical protein
MTLSLKNEPAIEMTGKIIAAFAICVIESSLSRRAFKHGANASFSRFKAFSKFSEAIFGSSPI